MLPCDQWRGVAMDLLPVNRTIKSDLKLGFKAEGNVTTLGSSVFARPNTIICCALSLRTHTLFS